MRVIPIKLLATAPGGAADDQARLERAGFMRMMVIGEPRLSEFVKAYENLGYEVEVVPFETEAAGSEADGQTALDDRDASRTCGTVYVRKRTPPAGA